MGSNQIRMNLCFSLLICCPEVQDLLLFVLSITRSIQCSCEIWMSTPWRHYAVCLFEAFVQFYLVCCVVRAWFDVRLTLEAGFDESRIRNVVPACWVASCFCSFFFRLLQCNTLRNAFVHTTNHESTNTRNRTHENEGNEKQRGINSGFLWSFLLLLILLLRAWTLPLFVISELAVIYNEKKQENHVNVTFILHDVNMFAWSLNTFGLNKLKGSFQDLPRQGL